jgi:hypothetical protein
MQPSRRRWRSGRASMWPKDAAVRTSTLDTRSSMLCMSWGPAREECGSGWSGQQQLTESPELCVEL